MAKSNILIFPKREGPAPSKQEMTGEAYKIVLDDFIARHIKCCGYEDTVRYLLKKAKEIEDMVQ